VGCVHSEGVSLSLNTCLAPTNDVDIRYTRPHHCAELAQARRKRGRTITKIMKSTDDRALRAMLASLVARPRAWRVVGGIGLCLLSILTLLTLLGLNTGGVIVHWARLAQQAFGLGVFPLCLALLAGGIQLLLRPMPPWSRRSWVRLIAAEVAFLALLGLFHSLAFGSDPYQLVLEGSGGGAVGWVLAELAWRALGATGSQATLGLRLLTAVAWLALLVPSALIAAAPWLRPGSSLPQRSESRAASLAPAPIEDQPAQIRQAKAPAQGVPQRAHPSPAAAEASIVKSKPKSKPSVPRSGDLPPLTLLQAVKQPTGAQSDAEVKRKAAIIETTLAQFGLAARVAEIRVGPTITQFGVEPGYVDRSPQQREKAAQRLRNAVASALYESINVALSADRTAALLELPTAIVDAREAGFRALLRNLLSELDLSTSIAEGERRAGRAYFEIGADTERKLRIKLSQVNGLRGALTDQLMARLFRFDDFAQSDLLTERLTIRFPAGLGEAINLKETLEATLASLGLAGSVITTKRAPQAVVEWQKQAQKVRVSAIAALQNDLALALAAPSIRIEAPIPGRALVGIEVPNAQVSPVDLRSLMESEAFRRLAEKSPLAIALGRDVSGAPYAADLARMPHLLIAGTTGSGKSVCISTITVCLAMNNRPEDLKLVLIDPKMVELSRFAGLPHVIGKPESDIERIPAVLRWVTREMDARYKQFAQLGARNLAEYNQTMARRDEPTLPYIVVLIDELADLMLQSPIETEKIICRLAQMARATGIHLVVATQRPSVDVVTGLIKANFPARISFAVASATDSRVILDQTGAESLLGRGDMLFLNPESGNPVRLQGAFVSEREIRNVIEWWQKQMAGAQQETGDAPWESVVAEVAAERAHLGGRGSARGEEGDDDGLIERAMEIIRTTGNVSTSLLQRKLRIGYPRAARLMEELQEMGYVSGPSRQAGKGREVIRD